MIGLGCIFLGNKIFSYSTVLKKEKKLARLKTGQKVRKGVEKGYVKQTAAWAKPSRQERGN